MDDSPGTFPVFTIPRFGATTPSVPFLSGHKGSEANMKYELELVMIGLT